MSLFSVDQLSHVLRDKPDFKECADLADCVQCHFSQQGEDTVVYTYLSFVRRLTTKGIIVDFGAYHPYRYSNTFLFYLLGWRCVNVDANLEAIELFKKLRSSDTNLHALIAEEAGVREYFKFPEGGYNTTLREAAEFLLERGKTDANTATMIVEQIQATTPNAILETHVGNAQFDFLNIDLEGLDEQILRSIDFTRFRPQVIATEVLLTDITSGSIGKFMTSVGYGLFAHCGNTAILVDSRR